MKKKDIVSGIDIFGNLITGEYDGKSYWGGKLIGYWIITYAPSYEGCPKEDNHRILHEIKELIN
jgi:hypothetical protein|tara:strand:- start:1063 stop:1254 length:192 start_codon:yes stop_codon:yes gene_type:complete